MHFFLSSEEDEFHYPDPDSDEEDEDLHYDDVAQDNEKQVEEKIEEISLDPPQIFLMGSHEARTYLEEQPYNSYLVRRTRRGTVMISQVWDKNFIFQPRKVFS